MKKKTLQVTCIQTHLAWEDADANRDHFATKINSIERACDIIVLPEMFTTGFSMRPQPLAETMDGPTVKWMMEMASRSNAVISGSVIIEDKGSFVNRFLWVAPAGNIDYYDKRHLFTLAGEDEQYTAGNELVVVDCQGWKIRLNVCYDLRFPVWSRNTQQYDALFYVANWPKPRAQAWSTLLRARAIENQCFVVGVNRIGSDANNNDYIGQSAIIDMEGNYLGACEDRDEILQVTLNKNDLEQFRSRYPFYQDRDQFKLL